MLSPHRSELQPPVKCAAVFITVHRKRHSVKIVGVKIKLDNKNPPASPEFAGGVCQLEWTQKLFGLKGNRHRAGGNRQFPQKKSRGAVM